MVKFYKIIAENRMARHEYHILDTLTAGIILKGAEVKSLRLGRVNLKDSFARVESGEIWLYNTHISPYERASEKIDPYRNRKLLLSKQELKKAIGKVSEKGLTLIPLKMYFSGDWAKVEIALAKAKKKYEKREKLVKKSADKEIERALKGNR
ncbi:SsrA-binding protein [candidate division WOR-1 bacterium RIFOXYD2_FULL_36_8]|uniref:SsrA-binding protein n=1 Tax=candidate division WOR-1 bacterium RIFOXYB2_FULL_36_35 TaxID=1802578 RepID=A0A1F4S125_UNCSA|nr:MAG: SsrA-binding protein [candidate division WOR-1 bacterium RIFOXYA2_FULL_36_21]OGC14097.1 MAG: SsrA-binding protein [candidate division WOR-1 bacterium RIFOXYB2_FULL_36_35]OGC16527.1 MAG: SsrA-binding protein [candidate division WOR-1 bacterium RIFOXYA12_FULL_36_13]OGC39724.1 MAG: SsrA-binding protein [candidate division WOR-1 bacterium RIFOXYD2_FULL_36_8]